jgi:hypothetical protein
MTWIKLSHVNEIQHMDDIDQMEWYHHMNEITW